MGTFSGYVRVFNYAGHLAGWFTS